MKYDKLGIAYANTDELCDLLYQSPDIDLSKIFVEDPNNYNDAVKSFYLDFPTLKLYNLGAVDLENYDAVNQSLWNMPEEYSTMNIAQWILNQCQTHEELQRVGQELLLFQERNLFSLLKQLKYIVDTWRANNIVWGVGRGSSVASYVLFLIGVHKINSMYYDLDIAEFLR
jgi:DNA polymerase III alpha subunit